MRLLDADVLVGRAIRRTMSITTNTKQTCIIASEVVIWLHTSFTALHQGLQILQVYTQSLYFERC